MMRKGLTIVEFLSYAAVLSIILGAIVFFFVNVVRNERSLTNRVGIADEIEFALRQIIDDGRGSVRIVPEGTGVDASHFSNTASPTCTTNCALVFERLDGGSARLTKYWINGDNKIVVRKEISDTENDVRELTSSRVKVEKFIVRCIGSGVSNPCETEIGGAQIEITMSVVEDPADQETMISSVTPRGF